jgi:transcriptional regulator with XRE-family HTH domain
MAAAPIGARIKALREQRALSQDDLARQFGFKDRQIVSAIEIGGRRVSAEELLRAVDIFCVQLDYFTDPFLLAGRLRGGMFTPSPAPPSGRPRCRRCARARRTGAPARR